MRYGELFAGAGGMSLGLERAGMRCAFHAELADFPRRVLRHRWPETPLYGDVAELDGRALVQEHGAIDLLAGGSPCQDLSVAGKRAGLSGARSGLFYQQLRLWEETGATYLLWENVAGALSSNNGKDFAAVLSAIVGATVVVPRDGWGGDESGGGVAAGPRAVAAWRLLDAQYFGVPQRRLRVFVLGARAGGVDPAEVLLEPQGVRRHPPPRREAGQRVADSLTVGANQTCGFPGDDISGDDISGDEDERVISFVLGSDPISRVGGAAQPVTGRNGGPGCVVAFDTTQITSAVNRANPRAGDTGHPLAAQAHAPLVVTVSGESVRHALTHEGHDASEDGTGRGTPIVVFNETGHERWMEESVAGSLNAHEAKEAHTIVAPTLNGTQRQQVDGAMAVTAGIPRRLMPVECCRLMSWPDTWLDVPDEKGKMPSDAVKYKAAGNGVVSNVAEWIAARLIALEEAAQERAA